MAYSAYAAAALAISDKVDAAMTVTANTVLAPGYSPAPSPLYRQILQSWLSEPTYAKLPRICLAVVADGTTTNASSDAAILARVAVVVAAITPY